jgi:kynurenine formamidase
LLLKGQQKDGIAGFASINYRLSPYCQHSTNPSSSDDPSRNSKHPDHIHDALAAIYFLQQKYGFGERYLLAGHSCGATLAFQVVMGVWNRAPSDMEIALPLGILGLEGIYDFVKIRDHHRNISAYQNFLEGAFGEFEGVWVEASPSSGDYGKTWPNGKLALIVHSLEDELVEKEQAMLMGQTLATGERNTRTNIVEFLEAGKHDEIWGRGTVLATMIEKAVRLITEG